MRQEYMVIVDGDGREVCSVSDEGATVDLTVYEYVQVIAIGANIDIGGVRALCDWLAAWLEQREEPTP